MYLITKMIKRTKDGFLIACKNGQRSVTLHGNVPVMFAGMSVDFKVDGQKILDYDIYSTNRNINILQKHLDDIESVEEYWKKVSLHKSLETVLWRELDKSYTQLPFEKADKIALMKGKEPTCKERITCINKKIINDFRGNDASYFTLGMYIDAFKRIEETGSFGKLELFEIMELFANEKMFGIDKNGAYDKELINAENYIRQTMSERNRESTSLIKTKIVEDYIENNHFLSDDQKEAVKCLTNSRPDFITGGAGTGKTTVIKALIDCYSRQFELGGLGLLAPTGRASERMNEVIGLEAFTIHSALRKTPESEFVFYNENNPLLYNLIIVDESSMIDSLLMADLLHATQLNCKIVFVGDCNQLPPVSCGRPFFDFLSSGRFYELKNNHRQGEGNIVLKNAYHILNDEPLEEGENFIIKRISKNSINRYTDRNIQCITPYNALNDVINQHLKCSAFDNFSAGDKVLATKNTKDYCNGDLFEIVRIETKTYTLQKIGKSDVIIVDDLDDFVLAYSITIHKMQGSECDAIKLFLPEKDKFVTKNMLYTAVTRAKKKVELYYYS